MNNEVVTTKNNAPALSGGIMERLAAQAKAAAATERPAVGRISLKSGVMSYGGTAMPGNKTEAVVVASVYRNVFYAGRYDANNVVNPNCFASSDSDKDMAPHANVSEPEHATCDGCPKNEWGSDPNGGRGKACKQTRRLVLIPGHAVEGGAAAVNTAELAILDLPVTSVKNYSSYVNALAASAKVPPFAAVAEISVVPDAKTQFKVNFKPIRVLPTEELLAAVEGRTHSALALGLEPYEETSTAATAEEAAPAKAPAKKKF
jgi:hypothetical protein